MIRKKIEHSKDRPEDVGLGGGVGRRGREAVLPRHGS